MDVGRVQLLLEAVDRAAKHAQLLARLVELARRLLLGLAHGLGHVHHLFVLGREHEYLLLHGVHRLEGGIPCQLGLGRTLVGQRRRGLSGGGALLGDSHLLGDALVLVARAPHFREGGLDLFGPGLEGRRGGLAPGAAIVDVALEQRNLRLQDGQTSNFLLEIALAFSKFVDRLPRRVDVGAEAADVGIPGCDLARLFLGVLGSLVVLGRQLLV